MADTSPPDDPAAPITADAAPTRISAQSALKGLREAALGTVNTARHLWVFESFDLLGRAGLVWNPAAAFCTVGWMVFWRLWNALAAYLLAMVVPLAGLALAHRYLTWPVGVELGLLVSLLLLGTVLPGLYGHALLYGGVRRRIERSVRQARTLREAGKLLQAHAGSPVRLHGVLLLGGVLALVVATVVWQSWPLSVRGSRLPVIARPAPEAPAPWAENEARVVETKAETLPVQLPTREAETPPVPTPDLVALPATSAGLSQKEPATATVAPPPAPEPPVAVSAASKPDVAKTTAARSAPPSPAKTDSAIFVNVGLFADAANAHRAHARLIDAGLPAQLQPLETSKGQRSRVRVGPYASREQADQAVARIQAMELDAVIVRP